MLPTRTASEKGSVVGVTLPELRNSIAGGVSAIEPRPSQAATEACGNAGADQ